MGAVISRVDPYGVGGKYGFKVGDEIITINGQLLTDILDYHFITTEHKLAINFVRNGYPYSTVVHKEESESLGLDFTSEVFDGIRKCTNKCIFCFEDQMPRTMRKSLFIRDDDYRLSFLHGSYISLTNLSESDIRRITGMRLSPLYVSIHATDPQVRTRMMGSNQAGNIMKSLAKLKTHNIQFHAQIVVIPGINDGKVLKGTLQDLFNLHPTVRTVAIVPVGVTKYRQKDDPVRPVKEAEAKQIYDLVGKFQKKAEQKFHFPLFYLADEFYILLNKNFPRYSHYGFFDQMGNGVGLCRKFITDFNRRKRYLPRQMKEVQKIWAVTGELGYRVLNPLVKDFEKINNLDFRLMPVENSFFGRTVTVTGLLTGQDILNTLKRKIQEWGKPDKILLPDIVLRDHLFLDDVTLEELQKETGVEIDAIPSNATGLIDGILKKLKISLPPDHQIPPDEDETEDQEHIENDENDDEIPSPAPPIRKKRIKGENYSAKAGCSHSRKTQCR